MTDQVLTDEEKDALLDGMESGEVEVQTGSGAQYANVREFEIGPRARIVSNSYPRLQLVNQQLATRLAKQVEQMLNAETDVSAIGLRNCTFTEYCERSEGLVILIEFTPNPLQGAGFVHMDASMVAHLVETFYGGGGNDSPHQADSFFTAGEVSVARLFADNVLAALAEAWQPITAIEPEKTGAHQDCTVVESIDANDMVIATAFNITIAGRDESFAVLWPLDTVAPLVPVFEGQKRERDAAEDARWAHAIRSRITDSTIKISSRVGRTRMTLGDVAELKPGAVFDISNPQFGTVFASSVPVLEGRFGIHDGRYAMEAGKWLQPETTGDNA